jgi:hypothetical protein
VYRLAVASFKPPCSLLRRIYCETCARSLCSNHGHTNGLSLGLVHVCGTYRATLTAGSRWIVTVCLDRSMEDGPNRHFIFNMCSRYLRRRHRSLRSGWHDAEGWSGLELPHNSSWAPAFVREFLRVSKGIPCYSMTSSRQQPKHASIKLMSRPSLSLTLQRTQK